MRMPRLLERSLATISAIAAALLVTMTAVRPAVTSPLEDVTLGGAVFTGVTQSDANAIYLNPAALGLVSQGWHIQIDGSARVDRRSVRRARLLDPSAEPVDGPDINRYVVSPGWSVAAYNNSGQVSVGFSLSVPGAGVFRGIPLSAAQYDRFTADEPDLGWYALEGRMRAFHFGAVAVGFRASARIFAGTGLQITTSDMCLSFLRDTALEAGSGGSGGIGSLDCNGDGTPCGIENPAAAERYDLDLRTGGTLDRQNYAVNGGLMIKLLEDWWLGLAYRAPPGTFTRRRLSGRVDVTTAPRDVALGAPATVTGVAEIGFRLPHTFQAGLRGRLLHNADLIIDLRWQTLSRHRELDLRMFGGNLAAIGVPESFPRHRGFQDVLTAQIGVEGLDGGRIRGGGRLRLETAATADDKITPLDNAGLQIGGAGGVQYAFRQQWVFTASAGVNWFPGATVTDSQFDPRDRLACVDSGFDLDACRAAGEGRALPSAAGSYGRVEAAFRFGVRWDQQ